MDFKNKYLKYKKKYISLKNQQKSGGAGGESKESKSEKEDELKVTLVSNEGAKYVVSTKVASMINLIKTMLPVENARDQEEIPLPLVDTDTLSKVIEFCEYYVDNQEEMIQKQFQRKIKDQIKIKKPLQSTDISEVVHTWYNDFVIALYADTDMFVKLINAAHYLDIYQLEDLLLAKVASMIKGSDNDEKEELVSQRLERMIELQESMTFNYLTFDELLSFGLHSPNIIDIRVEKMVRSGIRVPQDCETLKDAVELVQWHMDQGKYNNYSLYIESFTGKRFSTIVVGKGEHQIDGKYLEIASAMNIVGDPGVPKSEIVIVGGIKFKKGIPGNCHLQHLALRQAKRTGVVGYSSFTMEDVLVEQCGGLGVGASGTGGVVGRCTNVEVRQCGWSGVLANNGASITLIGAKTTVHHNCTKGDSDDYGLQVWGSTSTIQLVSPLTKEQVSFDNGGGGNWGAEYDGDINQIKTISQADMEAAVVAGR